MRCSLAGSSKRFAHDCFAPMLKQNVRSLNSTASARSLAQLTLPACSVAARLKRRLCRSLQEEGALPADKNERLSGLMSAGLAPRDSSNSRLAGNATGTLLGYDVRPGISLYRVPPAATAG